MGLLAGMLLLYAVWRVEGSDRHRMLPRNSVRTGGLLLPIYLSMSLMVMGMACEVFVPYFLQVLHLQTPLVAGYVAALMAAGWTLGSLYSCGLSREAANRAMLVAPLLVVTGLALAGLFVPQTSASLVSLGGVSVAMVLVGTGIGLATSAHPDSCQRTRCGKRHCRRFHHDRAVNRNGRGCGAGGDDR